MLLYGWFRDVSMSPANSLFDRNSSHYKFHHIYLVYQLESIIWYLFIIFECKNQYKPLFLRESY